MLHLQELVKQDQQTQVVVVNDRLPDFLGAPCQLEVNYRVEMEDDFYLIHLRTTGVLQIICQRCMDGFPFSYDNETTIAVCRNDERAEQLLERYECIVSSTWSVDLLELIVDELHLYAPLFHPENNDCGSEINKILTGKMESY